MMIKKSVLPVVAGCFILYALNSAVATPAPAKTATPAVATAPAAAVATAPTPTVATAPAAAVATAPTPTVAMANCAKGFNELEIAVYTLVSASPPYSSATNTVLGLISECHKTASSGEQKDREAYLNFLQSLDATINSVKTLLTSTASSDNDKNKIVELQKVRQAILIEQQMVDTRGVGWEKDYEANFHLGYEGTTVSGMSSKNTKRIGMIVYSQLFGPQQCDNDCKQGRVTWFPGFKPVLFGDIMLSSAVSSSNTGTTDTSLSSGSTGSVSASSSIGVTLNIFLPVITQKHSFGLIAIGPIGSFEFEKPDSTDQFTTAFFYGFRFANSPFTYFDVMYGSVGRIQGISGGRLSLRGQYQVGDALSGHVFVGGSADMSSHVLESNPPGKTEWFKIYAMWQVALGELIKK